jgi:hypothetical protein
MQMLRPGDTVSVIDHDIVEDRNLTRQHFTERDIGRPKALVLTERYRRAGIATTAFAHPMAQATNQQLARDLPPADARTGATAVIGCVDNWRARTAIKNFIDARLPGQRAWIDVGNETRGGQVLMNLIAWPLIVPGVCTTPAAMHVPAFEAMPQLLRAQAWDCVPCGIRNAAGAEECSGCQQPEASCGQRIDMQTVMVNHMAAASALNCLSWLILGIPFTSCGAFFSTLNTMQPIQLTRWDPGRVSLVPDTTFATAAE